MNDESKIEELLTIIINLFASAFSNKAVLRGGMVLRLLDSPRLTNDLDYIFVPHKSKKDIIHDILRVLKTIEGASITYSLNSKCLRYTVKKGELLVQVEATVSTECKVDILSTAPLSKIYNQTPRIISVMAYDVAMAHKLAAWYERRLMRDLYDIYLYINMGIKPDYQILTERLKKPSTTKGSKIKLKAISLEDFLEILKNEVRALSKKTLDRELRSILPPSELLGLELKIKNAILNRL